MTDTEIFIIPWIRFNLCRGHTLHPENYTDETTRPLYNKIISSVNKFKNSISFSSTFRHQNTWDKTKAMMRECFPILSEHIRSLQLMLNHQAFPKLFSIVPTQSKNFPRGWGILENLFPISCYQNLIFGLALKQTWRLQKGITPQ